VFGGVGQIDRICGGGHGGRAVLDGIRPRRDDPFGPLAGGIESGRGGFGYKEGSPRSILDWRVQGRPEMGPAY
jgi:hypothetical protein